MIQTKILKSQGMTFSMIFNYLNHQRHMPSLLYKTQSYKHDVCVQSRKRSDFRNKPKEIGNDAFQLNELQRSSLSEKWEKVHALRRIESKKLPAVAKRVLRLFKTVEPQQDCDDNDIKLTGVTAFIRAYKFALYNEELRSFSVVLQNPMLFESWDSEIEIPPQTSVAYAYLCLKLDIPYGLVSGFSGCHALLKLCKLTPEGGSIYDYSSPKLAVDAVFGVAAQQVHLITGRELMELVCFRFKLKDFQRHCFRKVIGEFKAKMTTNNYSIKELMSFINLLDQVDKSALTKDERIELKCIIQILYDYISSKPDCIQMKMLADMYTLAPMDNMELFRFLRKTLRDNIDHLSKHDLVTILKEIHKDVDICKDKSLVKTMLERGLESLTAADMEVLLRRFANIKYIDSILIETLPTFLLKSVKKKMSSDLVVSILAYFMLDRRYNRMVLKIACNHYIQDTVGYTDEQLGCLLKAIGMFNFLPDSQRVFFTKVEDFLLENFYNIDVLTLLEMFVSLIYIDKVAVNFEQFIFKPLFLGLVNEMQKEDRIRGMKYLSIIQCAFTARGVKPRLTIPADPTAKDTKAETGPSTLILHRIAKVLGDTSLDLVKTTPTWSGYYLEIPYYVLPQENSHEKFAFLIMTNDSFCKNAKDIMLGHEQTNIRLLQEKNMDVATAHIKHLQELKEDFQILEFLKTCLRGIRYKGRSPESSEEEYNEEMFDDDDELDI